MAVMVPSKVDPSLAPPGYSCITLVKFLPHNLAVTWDRNDPVYAARKDVFGGELIAMAERAIPGLAEHIIYRQDASPATFSRYAWTGDGAIYSLAIDQWRPSTLSPVKGLYIAGAGVSKRPGVEDAVYTGIRVAETIIKEKQAILKRT